MIADFALCVTNQLSKHLILSTELTTCQQTPTCQHNQCTEGVTLKGLLSIDNRPTIDRSTWKNVQDENVSQSNSSVEKHFAGRT